MNKTQLDAAHFTPHAFSLNCVIKHSALKRCFDVFFSLIALTLMAPFLLIIILLIFFTSKGKIVYSHERIGRGGKPFRCYKFRSMYADADHRLQELLKSNPEMKREWEKNYKLKNDPRITHVGAFLRKTSLDELPQFWNVIKGDLSVVGPRPVVKEELQKHFGHKASKILSVRPGLTGLWQVSGRSDISYSQRIALDEKYIEQQSLKLDMKLILKTIPAMIFSKGAY